MDLALFCVEKGKRMPLAIDGMKECNKCHKLKSVEEFYSHKKNSDKLQTTCKICESTRGKEFRNWINSFKDKPCDDCGKQYPSVLMDFDHVPERGIKLSVVGALGYSKVKILEEIEKCDVVCPTCHRIRTVTRLGLLTEEDLNVISKL